MSFCQTTGQTGNVHSATPNPLSRATASPERCLKQFKLRAIQQELYRLNGEKVRLEMELSLD